MCFLRVLKIKKIIIFRYGYCRRTRHCVQHASIFEKKRAQKQASLKVLKSGGEPWSLKNANEELLSLLLLLLRNSKNIHTENIT